MSNDLIILSRAGLRFVVMAIFLGLPGACATGETLPDENPALRESWKFTENLPEEYRRSSFNIVGGEVFEITPSGLSKARLDPARAGARLGDSRRIIAVHGTMYDPDAPGLDNPHLTVFQVIRAQLGGRAALTGIGWPSAPFSAENLGAAWAGGGLAGMVWPRKMPKIPPHRWLRFWRRPARLMTSSVTALAAISCAGCCGRAAPIRGGC
ncbi:MAG TPA: hypothetical protein PLI13_01105 [Paracoccus sp. (in: a-proteobacteria)]|nr:hypothetical protein [Paracoccus sp. (in: a-proteobacteria)]